MSAYSRLTRFTRDDAQAAGDTRRLGKGILKAASSRGSQPTSAGYQPHKTGLHFRNTIPMILQFPLEVLCIVFTYLEPIWLLQLEEAHPILDDFLSIQRANKIWYELLLATLMSEPECFQDEIKVAKILEAFRKAGAPDNIILPNPSEYMFSGISAITYHAPEMTMASRTWSLAKSTIDDRITLPQIDHLSKLSRTLHTHFCNRHPHNDDQYPLITGNSMPIRARVLAIDVKLPANCIQQSDAISVLKSSQQPKTEAFEARLVPGGMRVCEDCLEQWTINSEDIDKVSELRPLLKKSEGDAGIRSIWLNRFKEPSQASWKPYVDSILRKEIGIDFDTAVAKEEYMRQVSKALTATKKPITALRQALRREIVQVAQDLSTSPSYDNMPASLAKQTFARPTELSKFLFPAGLLYEEKMFEPYDPDEAWLSDPTKNFTLSRDVRRKLGDATWKNQKAREMLNILFQSCSCGGGVTAPKRAADQYHVQRISESISANTTIDTLNKKIPPQESPFVRTPAYWAEDGEHTIVYHLDVFFSKIHIYRDDFPYLPQHSPHGLKLAMEIYFKKLALQTCIACPHSGMLTSPRGVEGFVQHYREAHPQKYWSSHKWAIVG